MKQYAKLNLQKLILFDGIFKKTTECSLDEWCTGPANETTAVLGSSQLCKKGDTDLSKL